MIAMNIVSKCLSDQDYADWMDKGPFMEQSLLKTALGLQNPLSDPPSPGRSGATKTAIS